MMVAQWQAAICGKCWQSR